MPDALGTCVAVPADDGVPHGDRPECPGDGVGDDAACKGRCDGSNRASCVLPGDTTECRPPSCTDGTATLQAFCRGSPQGGAGGRPGVGGAVEKSRGKTGDGDCGCRFHARNGSGASLIALVLGLSLVRRRRRRTERSAQPGRSISGGSSNGKPEGQTSIGS